MDTLNQAATRKKSRLLAKRQKAVVDGFQRWRHSLRPVDRFEKPVNNLPSVLDFRQVLESDFRWEKPVFNRTTGSTLADVELHLSALDAQFDALLDLQRCLQYWMQAADSSDPDRSAIELRITGVSALREQWAREIKSQHRLAASLHELERSGRICSGQLGRSALLLLALLVFAGGLKVLLIEWILKVELIRGLEWAALSLMDPFELTFALLMWLAGSMTWRAKAHGLRRVAAEHAGCPLSAAPEMRNARRFAAGIAALTAAAFIMLNGYFWSAALKQPETQLCITRVGNQCVMLKNNGPVVRKLALEDVLGNQHVSK